MNNEVPLEQLFPLIHESLEMGNHVTFCPRGTSMLPMLRQGRDTVTLSPLPLKLKKYDLPLYRRDNGQFVLHRIIRVGDTYTCMGDNQFVLETGIRHDQMIAVVSGFTRDGRKYAVNSTAYRMYCLIWDYSRPVRYVWKRTTGWLRRILK